MKWMMKNSRGQRDGMWTFAVISFIVVTLSVVASFFQTISIGHFTLELNEPNVSLLTLYFGGAFTSYVVRRHTKDNAEAEIVKTGIMHDSE